MIEVRITVILPSTSSSTATTTAALRPPPPTITIIMIIIVVIEMRYYRQPKVSYYLKRAFINPKAFRDLSYVKWVWGCACVRALLRVCFENLMDQFS